MLVRDTLSTASSAMVKQTIDDTEFRHWNGLTEFGEGDRLYSHLIINDVLK